MFSDQIISTATSVATQLNSREPSTVSSYWTPYFDVSQKILDSFRDMKGYKVGGGMYRYTIIAPDAVIKFSQGEHRQTDIAKETRFIRRMIKHPKYGRHFPQTKLVKVGNIFVQVQEKVDMGKKRMKKRYAGKVEMLAKMLGIDDMHTENWGWKGEPGKEYPVFIDVDFRTRTRISLKADVPKRSWEIF